MAYALIPVLLLLAVWVGVSHRRLRELEDNINTAMNQIGLQLSSRFRALDALLALIRSYGLSAQLVLPPPSINAFSTPAQVLEQEQRLAHAMAYVTAVAESHPAIKADKTYLSCMEAANCYSRMVYTSSLIYNDSVYRFNNTLQQKRFGLLARLMGFAPREYLQLAPDAPAVCSAQSVPSAGPVQPIGPIQKEPA